MYTYFEKLKDLTSLKSMSVVQLNLFNYYKHSLQNEVLDDFILVVRAKTEDVHDCKNYLLPVLVVYDLLLIDRVQLFLTLQGKKLEKDKLL